MGLFFKFGQEVLGIFELQCYKKELFYRQDIEGTYIFEVAPERTFLRSVLAIFWE